MRNTNSNKVRVYFQRNGKTGLIVKESFGKFSVGDFIVINDKLQVCEEIQSTLSDEFEEKRANVSIVPEWPLNQMVMYMSLETYFVQGCSERTLEFLGYTIDEIKNCSITDIYDLYGMPSICVKKKLKTSYYKGKLPVIKQS